MEEPSAEYFVLVIEDNLEQVELIQNAFQADASLCRVEAIAEKTEVLSFLQNGAERPDIILLNLSGEQGRDILTELKSSEHLRRIPVVILTDSTDEENILSSYTLQGNSYVIKSSDRDRLYEIVQRIKAFWLGIVTLPSE
jgi:two-component system, chemotaxis family, response regulator Rcp1